MENNWKNKEKGTLYYACKECWNAANKERYHRNKQYYVNKANKFKQSVKKTAYERIFKYLADKKCVDCGENDPVVLQFDHVRGEKINCVSALVGMGHSWAIIESEIAKCEIRCANCHIRKTAKQFNWYSVLEG